MALEEENMHMNLHNYTNIYIISIIQMSINQKLSGQFICKVKPLCETQSVSLPVTIMCVLSLMDFLLITN